MPYLLIVLAIMLPALDIFATFRVANLLNVPGWLFMVPGLISGFYLLYEESRTAKARFRNALPSHGLPGMLLDNSRRLLAAFFLLAPGLISDVFALGLLLMSRRQPQAVSAKLRRLD